MTKKEVLFQKSDNKPLETYSKNQFFEKGNSDWLSELQSITKTYNNTFHHSIKMTPTEASLKKNEDIVYFNLSR